MNITDEHVLKRIDPGNLIEPRKIIWQWRLLTAWIKHHCGLLVIAQQEAS